MTKVPAWLEERRKSSPKRQGPEWDGMRAGQELLQRNHQRMKEAEEFFNADVTPTVELACVVHNEAVDACIKAITNWFKEEDFTAGMMPRTPRCDPRVFLPKELEALKLADRSSERSMATYQEPKSEENPS